MVPDACSTPRVGVYTWLVITLEEVSLVLGVGSSLKKGVFAWIGGIGSKVSGTMLRNPWSPEKRAGSELMQEQDSNAKDLPGTGEYGFFDLQPLERLTKTEVALRCLFNSLGRSLHLEKVWVLRVGGFCV